MLVVGACLCFVLRFEIVCLALTESKILQEFSQKKKKKSFQIST